MDKSLKIVLSTLALYAILSLQFLVEKGVFIIPYMLNPIVIWVVSVLIVMFTMKQSSFKNNLLYCVGISVYCFTSERTLNLIYNQTEVSFFIEIIQNSFLRLISILGLILPVLVITFRYIKYKFGIYLLILVLSSSVFGLIGWHYVYTALFTVYTLGFLLAVNRNKNRDVHSRFSPVVYQLFLFTIIEGIFSFIL